VFRVLKPGAYLLAFGGTRTYHRMVCGLEDAGFEILDQIDWVYGSGFPKSYNLARAADMKACQLPGRHYSSKLPEGDKAEPGDHICPETAEGQAYAGQGTALKPAHEPICVARKPLSEKSYLENLRKWGTGALNVRACSVQRDSNDVPGWHRSGADGSKGYLGEVTFRMRPITAEEIQARRGNEGRWPTNLVLDVEAAKLLGDKARLFYTPKPSKAERDEGLEHLEEKAWVQWQTANGTSGEASSISRGRNTRKRNQHPCTKLVALMRYLVRLVTPMGGTVLDPLMGSGTTGVAAIQEGYYFIGIDNNPEYFGYAEGRLLHATKAKGDCSEKAAGGIHEPNGEVRGKRRGVTAPRTPIGFTPRRTAGTASYAGLQPSENALGATGRNARRRPVKAPAKGRT